MDKEELIARFESEMAKVKRPGIDKLMDYIRKSDFYTAPASTKFHLSCESGLLQHSLNVLDALRGLLQEEQTNEDGTKAWFYTVAGTSVAQVKDESVILIALLHDICKTYFYSKGAVLHGQRFDAPRPRPQECHADQELHQAHLGGNVRHLVAHGLH